jgi:integrase
MVCAFERWPGGTLYLGVPTGHGGYHKVSLGHCDREQAMREAKALAAKREVRETSISRLTVAGLFDLYTRAVLPAQSERHAAETTRAAEMWSRHLGATYDVRKLGPRHWETFSRLRASGELDSRGHLVADPDKCESVGPRVVAKDLKVLRAACRRATIERTESAAFLLEVDPTRGLTLPSEKNPRRPVYDAARCEKILAVAGQVKTRIGWGKQARWERSSLRTLVRLASDTGRRIGSILALQWRDWRPDLASYGKLRWRAEEDKLGKEWWAPVTPEVREELEQFRRERPGVGEALLFPAPNDAMKPVSVQLATHWLRSAEKLAKLEPLPRGAWHPFRRRWATERKHLSAKDVMAVGGWVDPTTLEKCYQVPDEETMEAVVLNPRRLLQVVG